MESPEICHAPVDRDTDKDGLPDAWEIAYGLNPLDATGRNGGDGDLDSDGFNNQAEYLADTNPRDASSRLRLTGIRSLHEGVQLDWEGGINAWQIVQRATALETNGTVWRDIFTNGPPTPAKNSLTETLGTNVTKFYRIRAERR